MFAICLFALTIPLVMAGDRCTLSHLKFCNCTEYKIDVPDTNASSLVFKSIAPTTRPKIRDPYIQTVVECNLHSKDWTTLEEISAGLYRKLVDKLSIADAPSETEQIFSRFPRLWLKNTRVRQLEIKDSLLSGDFIWKDEILGGQGSSLTWLSIIRCSFTGALTFDTIGTVNLKGLETLLRLEGLDLSNNYLVSVQESAFSNAGPNLKTVILSRNAIKDIQTGAFHSLLKLRYIDLSHNVLENVSRAFFSNESKHLRRINLSWNRIKTLPQDIFSSMPDLKIVDVSNNFLYSMPKEPWNSIWGQLQSLDISSNFIECNCDLKWLVEKNNQRDGEEKDLKQRVRGMCARSMPNLLMRHFHLDILTNDLLKCGDDDDFDDYDYENGIESKKNIEKSNITSK